MGVGKGGGGAEGGYGGGAGDIEALSNQATS